MAFDPPRLRVIEPLVAEAGNENPFKYSRSSFEFCESLFVRIVSILLATDGRLGFITSVDDGLEDIDQIAAIIADRVP